MSSRLAARAASSSLIAFLDSTSQIEAAVLVLGLNRQVSGVGQLVDAPQHPVWGLFVPYRERQQPAHRSQHPVDPTIAPYRVAPGPSTTRP